MSDRAALTGILFVLKTGIPWEYLPAEMGCGRGMTCWRRLRDWYQAGVWRWLYQVLLEELAQADRIDWDRAALDSAAVPAPGAKKRARTLAAPSSPCVSSPDGHGRLELTKFRNPKLVEIEPAIAPPNTLGLRSVMFTVESVDDTVARLRANGAELVGGVAQYEDK